MLSAVRTGPVEAEVELELAGGVLVVAVAHVEAELLAVVDHVEQHRTELLELVDVVAVGLGDSLGLRALGTALEPHHLGLDPDQELIAELLLELVGDLLEVLARVGVEQLTGLGVIAVAVDPGDAVVPGQDRERVEVGDGGQLGLLGAETDVVAVAIGEQVGGGAVDQLVALLGHLREERGHDALAHHPAGHRDLLEEHVLDALGLDPPRQLLDLLGAPRRVARLLERRRRGRDVRSGQHLLHASPEYLLGSDTAVPVSCRLVHNRHLRSFRPPTPTHRGRDDGTVPFTLSRDRRLSATAARGPFRGRFARGPRLSHGPPSVQIRTGGVIAFAGVRSKPRRPGSRGILGCRSRVFLAVALGARPTCVTRQIRPRPGRVAAPSTHTVLNTARHGIEGGFDALCTPRVQDSSDPRVKPIALTLRAPCASIVHANSAMPLPIAQQH